jgi:PHD/YefM family antitoxin component YafN of YafNO toxin-antitoxin module
MSKQSRHERKDVRDVAKRLDELVEDAGTRGRRVVIEKDGGAVAALVSARDLELLEAYEERREQSFALFDRLGKGFENVDPDEIELEAAKAVAEVREEMRRERDGPAK